MDHKPLRLANWNARSVASKSLELADFLRVHEVDICALTETHLKTNGKLWLPEHISIRLDRSSAAGGGVAVLVHRSLANYRVLPSFRMTFIEAIGVELETSIGPVTFIAAYCPRQCSDSDGTLQKFKNDLSQLTRRRSKFVIAGDLNARHAVCGDSRNNKNGTVLADDALLGHYVLVNPDEPTFYSPTGRGSTLDIFLSNIPDNLSPPKVFNELSSDHRPVIVEVGSEDADAVQHHQPKHRDYHRVDWVSFRDSVDSNINFDQPLATTEDIDRALEEVQQSVDAARSRHVREVPTVSKHVDIDITTKRFIRLRNIYRRQFQRTGQRDKQVQVTQLNNIIKDRLEVLRNSQFESKLESLPKLAKPFWKIAKILKTKPKPIPPLVPIDQNQTDLLVSPGEKANEIAKHFVSSHCIGQSMVSPFETVVNASVAEVASAPVDVPDDQNITADEVITAIKGMKNMKAPGFDGILNLELKNLSRECYIHISNIFNNCLTLAYYPAQWKLAKVIPIPKPGKDPSSSRSYRPISLLSSLSKVLEKLLMVRVMNHVNVNNIFLEEQFGFRKGRSTLHQLTRVANFIRSNRDVSKTTVMALLDIEKAFDNVWINGLIHKLYLFHFPLYLIKIIYNYLSNRAFQVSIGSILSNIYSIVAGVPQGSILGPILYNIFTSDLPPLGRGGQLALFADDTAIMFKGRVIRPLVNRLQAGLDSLATYFNNWKVRINAAKTQAIVLPHSKSERLVPPPNLKLKLGGCSIEWSNEVTYLGLDFDSKLIYRSHVQKLANRSTVMIRSLYPLINRRSKLNQKNRLAVFKQIFRPVIDYASPIWKSCAKTHRLRIQRIQNKILKMILKLPTHTSTVTVHRLAGVEMLDDRLNRINNNFTTRCIYSNIEIVQNLV